MTTELTVHTGDQIENAFEMKPRTLEQAMKFCEIMADSTLVPKDYQGKPGNIMVAIQLGQELGLSPLRSLKSIAVINGRATVWGDELLAMVLAHPSCEYIDENQSTEKEGVCRVKRKGHPEFVSRFTLEDAKRAGLLGKQGPWTQYTARMLKLRARGFGLRDKFADALSGLVTTEEAMDIQPQVEVQIEAPKTLKERLKEKVEETKPEAQGLERSSGDSPASEPATQDAPPPAPSDDPTTPFRRKLAACEATNKAINEWWRSVPESLKQELWADYNEALKAVKGK